MSASHEDGLIAQNGWVDQGVLMYAGAPLMFGVRLQPRGALSVASHAVPRANTHGAKYRDSRHEPHRGKESERRIPRS